MLINIEGGLEPYIKIAQIKVKFTDTLFAEALFVASEYDDLNSFCTLVYKLGTLEEVANNRLDINHLTQILLQDRIIVSGDDYKNWNADNWNTFPFQYVSDKLGLTIIN